MHGRPRLRRRAGDGAGGEGRCRVSVPTGAAVNETSPHDSFLSTGQTGVWWGEGMRLKRGRILLEAPFRVQPKRRAQVIGQPQGGMGATPMRSRNVREVSFRVEREVSAQRGGALRRFAAHGRTGRSGDWKRLVLPPPRPTSPAKPRKLPPRSGQPRRSILRGARRARARPLSNKAER